MSTSPARRGYGGAIRRRWILAVGFGLIALGIGKGVFGHKVAPPSQAQELQFVASAVRGELLDPHSALRSRANATVAIPAARRVGTIERMQVSVDTASAAQARGIAHAGSGGAIASVTIRLTPAGRALALRRALAHPTALRVAVSSESATRSLTVTIPR